MHSSISIKKSTKTTPSSEIGQQMSWASVSIIRCIESPDSKASGEKSTGASTMVESSELLVSLVQNNSEVTQKGLTAGNSGRNSVKAR